ncbi:hypothetical protein ACGFLT_25315 [Micromonospora chalcea]
MSDATMREALYQLGIADLQEPLTTDAAGDPTRGEQQSDDLARHTGAVEKLTEDHDAIRAVFTSASTELTATIRVPS